MDIMTTLKNLPQKASPPPDGVERPARLPRAPRGGGEDREGRGRRPRADVSGLGASWGPNGMGGVVRGPDHMGVGAGLGAGSRLGSPRGSRGVAGALAGQRARVAAGGVARAAADASPGDCAGEHTSGQAGSFDQ